MSDVIPKSVRDTPSYIPMPESQLVQGTPIIQESVPIIQESVPIIQESVPIAKGVEPIAEEILPIAEEILPVAKEVEPIAEEILPVAKEVVNKDNEYMQVKDSMETPKEGITLSADKSTLGMLSQNLNTNLLVTAAAYKALLSKLKDNVTDVEKQQGLEENIKEVENLEKMLSDLLVKVQTNLDIEADKIIDPTKVIEEATGSSKFMQTLLNTEAIAILAAMLAPIGLGGGGKRKKKTKRKRNRGKKATKRASKI